MRDLKHAREVARDAEQECDGRSIGQEDGRADAPFRARAQISDSAESKQRQRDYRSDRSEPEAVRDPAEMVQLTLRQSTFGNIDAEEICDREAAPQRRRPDRDGC